MHVFNNSYSHHHSTQIQLEYPSSIRLNLKLSLTPLEKLELLLQKIGEAAHELPKENENPFSLWVMKWKEEFRTYQLDTQDPQEKMRAAYALCFLYGRIELIIDLFEQETQKENWLSFKEQVKEIIANFLPSNRPIHLFLQNFKEKQELTLHFLKVKKIFENRENKILQSANQSNESIITLFCNLKEKLAQLQKEKTLSIQIVHQRLDLLTQSLNQLEKQMSQQIHHAKEIEMSMKIQENTLTKNLDHLEDKI